MRLRKAGGYALVAVAALAFGFLSAAQLRAQLINPSNRVQRNQALVRSVQDLERVNAGDRRRIRGLRGEISGFEKAAAQRSDATHRVAGEVADLRDHAGLSPLHGPGVVVTLAGGRPGPDAEGRTAYLVNFQDVQDTVNLLYEGGAEAVAVNGRRLSPMSGFGGAGGAILIDQGPPLNSPFTVSAVGNRTQMEQLLGEPRSLGDLRRRQQRYGLRLDVAGLPDVRLPAFDASLQVKAARGS